MSTSHPSPGPTPGRIRHHVRSIARLALTAKRAKMGGWRVPSWLEPAIRQMAHHLGLWSRTRQPEIESVIADLPPRERSWVSEYYGEARQRVLARRGRRNRRNA